MKKYTKLILSQLSERWAMIFLILVEIYASTLIFSVVWQDVARYLDALHLYDILSVDRMVLVTVVFISCQRSTSMPTGIRITA